MSNSSTTGARRRREKKAKPAIDDKNSSSSSKKDGQSNGTKDTDDMTLWEVFLEHPLIKAGKFILIPYALYLSYFLS